MSKEETTTNLRGESGKIEIKNGVRNKLARKSRWEQKGNQKGGPPLGSLESDHGNEKPGKRR